MIVLKCQAWKVLIRLLFSMWVTRRIRAFIMYKRGNRMIHTKTVTQFKTVAPPQPFQSLFLLIPVLLLYRSHLRGLVAAGRFLLVSRNTIAKRPRGRIAQDWRRRRTGSGSGHLYKTVLLAPVEQSNFLVLSPTLRHHSYRLLAIEIHWLLLPARIILRIICFFFLFVFYTPPPSQWLKINTVLLLYIPRITGTLQPRWCERPMCDYYVDL